MEFSSPLPFADARASLAAKNLLPTELTSAQLDLIDASIKRESFFSARVSMMDVLKRAFSTVSKIVDPTLTGQQPGSYMDKARAREQIRAAIAETGWTAEGAGVIPGSLQDLTSQARLNLIVETNVRSEQGKADFLQGNLPGVIDAFPAQELYRLRFSQQERDWPSRWRGAGGRFFGGGRMIALKSDPVWTAISRFGNPWPPFDFNSGMSVRDISRREAIAMGVLAAADKAQPNALTSTLRKITGTEPQASAADLPAPLAAALPRGMQIVDGILKLASQLP